MSNQVELAEEEDPTVVSKNFTRGVSYRHVTEEESQARRERKVVLGVFDDRDSLSHLKGLGLILDHMVKACIQHDHCPPEAEEAVREAWFEFLSAVSDSTNEPVIVNSRSIRQRLEMHMAKWGIRNDYIEIVTKDLPTDRRRRIQGLHQLLGDRCLSDSHILIYEQSPLFIYAHDWVCLFFELHQFPIPDWILQEYSTWGVSVKFVEAIKKKANTVKDTRAGVMITFKERRRLIRQLFVDIMSNEEIRLKHAESAPIINNPAVPHIEMETLVSVLIVGLRRANVGVLPVHVVNWIARGEVPFFSAHKCLNAPLDRLEYYRVKRTAHAYHNSIFCAHRCHSVREIEKSLKQMEDMGMDAKIRDAYSLLGPCLNHLGLDSLMGLCSRILDVIYGFSEMTIFEPPTQDKRKISYTTVAEKDYIASDIEVNDLVFATIIVAMKLVFPELHESAPTGGSLEHELTAEIIEQGVRYEIMSNRFSESEGINVKWWNSLSGNHKTQFLRFIERECFEELRESLVDDLRIMLHPLDGDLSDGSASKPAIILTAGPLSKYRRCNGNFYHETEILQYLIKDVVKTCQVTFKCNMSETVAQLENFLFYKSSKDEFLQISNSQ